MLFMTNSPLSQLSPLDDFAAPSLVTPDQAPCAINGAIDQHHVESFVQLVRCDHTGICQLLTDLSIHGVSPYHQAVINAGVLRLLELGDAHLAAWLTDMLAISSSSEMPT